MATYVMSDIHGETERFYRMLDTIGFSDGDMLYIIGDVIDRGNGGVDLLLDIMQRKNVCLLLGNHEYMCRRCYSSNATVVDRTLWERNANEATVVALGCLPSDKLEEVITYLNELPTYKELNVEGRKFYLVHGFPGKDEYERAWKRPDLEVSDPMPGYRVIIGHTPVNHLVKERSDENIDHLSVFHCEGFSCIDCGCGHSFRNRALACLRLEDMAEFYT